MLRCALVPQDKVIAAAQRLLDSANMIRSTVDLSGASLAIDDCYEVGYTASESGVSVAWGQGVRV